MRSLCAVVLGCCVLVGCGKSGSTTTPGTSTESKSTTSEADYRKLCLEYLGKNLDDPSVLEVVEWGALTPCQKDYYIPNASYMNLKFRTKNKFGAKVIAKVSFVLQNGKVVSSEPVD